MREIKRLKNFLETLKKKNPVDIRDFHIYGGLIMALAGLWLYSPAISLTVIGFVVFLLGILAGRVK